MVDRLSRHLLFAIILSFMIVATVAIQVRTASAATGITFYTAAPSTSQAGGHPDLTVEGAWLGRTDAPQDPCNCDDPRVTDFHYPTGFIGNPHSIPVCTLTDFTIANCPEASQVGVTNTFGIYTPVYNLETHPDQAGLLGFLTPIAASPVFIDLSGRTDSDYGLDAASSPIPHLFPIVHVSFTIWGVPADHSHDMLRFRTPLTGFGGGCGALGFPSCDDGIVTGAASPVPPAPYIQGPTTCGVPLTASLDVSYYNGVTELADYPWPATTGCQQLSFNPSLTAVPTTSSADTASGLDVDLKVPQVQDPNTPSPSEIRSTTLTLPQGFSVNANAADGKLACTDTDSAIGLTRGPATCPEFAKVGTLALDSSALPGPIAGAIYLGQPKPGDRYRLILAADGFGTHVKLAGSVHPDPQTGQLVTSFLDLPQSPLTEFSLHFFGSERGALATPTRCGTYFVKSDFVPWDDALPTQHSLSSFTIDSGPNGQACPGASRSFAPTLQAGVSNNAAGIHSPFVLKLNRRDGEQNLADLEVTTPPGFAATLAGIPYCPASAIAQLSAFGYSGLAEQASSACPQASRVGTAAAVVGAGTRPLHVAGNVYLAGPYKGAPLSLVVVIPAVSGPYDLGNVAVRAAIEVDPITAQVTAVSDPLPLILEGIPLRTRSIEVNLDRPDFTVNPTNCDPFAIAATVFADEDAIFSPSSHFQISNCATLPYSPKLAIRLGGGVNRRGHPAIHALFTAQPGEANTHSVTVTLPRGELLDNSHIGTVCTRVDFAKHACPAGSLIGHARVTTPLLAEPLQGPVYLRSSQHPLPDLALDLSGQFDVEATARVDSVRGRLRAAFMTVPDVPLTTVALDLLGGPKGLLQNSKTLCGAAKFATARMIGQNSAVLTRNVKLQSACGPRAKHTRKEARR